ncbi:hypothetical protein COU62_03380 [Candidatus Pacearchaeota archaeon CG10_big_fil_rev_8_21_14_0_10_35_219]|nr:hypothetical protein [Candidatus Pacearchaeota archaeon]OIO42367.1 MAG: hypothetical protein AUJ63_03780 [Candidatus Pacearchaeota archaeon CG1_02_35_32]PIO07396.1 MAG: hypothetical protein COU62_03380 [Candidatus Pacearchaeota archaeon CG10_big_fil_rev_8_21_14_0_10_35_219]PIY81675.1 MAG: hypothetical protein COY79_01210 [Candidatus Pacearchaeota archaeon CG_4_10_14_0_8_um_filter_35_169]PIZ79492.1 MAG: hypothetical protein COY00_03675 [Candidatus Pacearchaeota archaeon CG_4_10_14_0_2_um_filt
MRKKIILGALVLVGVATLVYAATLQQEMEVASCADGDFGLDFYNASGVMVQTLNGKNYTKLDFCYNNNTVIEYACDVRDVNGTNHTYGQAWSQNCLNLNSSGCYLGACF